MKRITLAGLVLILAECSSPELPEFQPSQHPRSEQVSTSCYQSLPLSQRLAIAQEVLNEIVAYEKNNNIKVNAGFFSPCETELIDLLVKQRMSQSEYRRILTEYGNYYKIYNDVWDKVFETARQNTSKISTISTD